MYQRYKDKAKFFIVYIREAHPAKSEEDAARQRKKGKAYLYHQATTTEQRAKAAGACLNDLKLTMPFVLDDIVGTTEKAYSGWPNRILVINIDDKVA